ncbi:MAG: hypothetical protein V4703_00795 [Actinomycetota bacterium]|nr:hypothetical protein [Microbacterium sp. KRD172]
MSAGSPWAGCRDTPNEDVDPGHSLAKRRQYIQSVCRLDVEAAPLLSRDNGRWPRLLTSILEEPDARRRNQLEVEVLSPIEKLKVNEVTSTFTAFARNSVELLRDLVLSAHHRHRPRRFQTDLGEEVSQVCREMELPC